MLLFWIVFAGVIVLTLYAVGVSRGQETKVKAKKGEDKNYQQAKEAEVAAKQQKILDLEGQTNSLKTELAKARTDYMQIKEELAVIKKKESDFKEELLKREKWVKTSDEALQKIKQQSLETEKRFSAKDKALEE